jgi:ribosomal protein S18 acetylase RimI-like enzyme
MSILYSLRQAFPSDLPFVTSLHHETLKEYIAPIWGWDEKQWDGFIAAWFKPERVQIIVWDDVDVGILVVEQFDSHYLFESISVSPHLQNRGLGTTVIRDVIARADKLHLPIKLDVLKSNILARRLYDRFGFTVIGENEAHIQMARPAP